MADEKSRETSFLIKAISSGSELRRAIILLLVIFLASSIGFTMLIFAVLELIDRLTKQFDQVSFSEQGYPIVKLKGKGTLQVLSVPSYHKWTASGITLNRKNKIEIKATGLVSTGYYIPDYISTEFNKKSNELDKRVSMLEFNRQMYLGWRYPNGELSNGQENMLSHKKDFIYTTVMDCVNKESHLKKLNTESRYGSLLVFFASKLENSNYSPTKIYNREMMTNLVEVGEGVGIEFKEDHYHVTSKSGTLLKKISAENGDDLDLYFVVNDSIVRDRTDLAIFSKCYNNSKLEPKVKDSDTRSRARNQEELFMKVYDTLKKIHDNDQDKQSLEALPEAMWYMDNAGEFTVTVVTND